MPQRTRVTDKKGGNFLQEKQRAVSRASSAGKKSEVPGPVFKTWTGGGEICEEGDPGEEKSSINFRQGNWRETLGGGQGGLGLSTKENEPPPGRNPRERREREDAPELRPCISGTTEPSPQERERGPPNPLVGKREAGDQKMIEMKKEVAHGSSRGAKGSRLPFHETKYFPKT